jgi:hypothetical protein
MQTAILNEILQIRSALKLLKKCYLDLEITKYMIKDIGTSSIYDKKDAYNPMSKIMTLTRTMMKFLEC